MNLTVDIGNSSAKAALFDRDVMQLRVQLGTDPAAELLQLASTHKVEACALAVVGEMPPGLPEALRGAVPFVLQVDGQTPTPLVCDYLSPRTLGADRLAAAVGAAALKPGRDLLVADVGTCITYDFVSADGHYLGGNISPGVGMRLRALHEQTARLPLVASQTAMPGPPTIGRTTETAMLAGVWQGIQYEIDGYISRFRAAHPQGAVFITGGNGRRFASDPGVICHHALVETGLNRILQHHFSPSHPA